ncbi:tellurite resistance protein TerB [mine drainage metagenome]|uniref:Tellurite resistance protein TerB n=1 Tax=mine drainage metagenome TaxID=410659 RepID=A0A1J5TCD6_9ZZZZ
MGKKNSGSPLLIGIVVVIWLLISIPREVWVGLVILALAVLGIRYFFKSPGTTGIVSLSDESSSQAGQRNARSPIARSSRVGSNVDDLVTITISDGRSGRDYSIPATPTGRLENVKWIPPGQQTTVAGIELSDGMVYVSTARRRDSQDLDPALIDPNLKVTSAEIDLSIPLLGYWPSYSTISPDARKAYLRWLSGGRNASSANIGYVFLFFYGLERRILVDAPAEPAARAEVPTIKAEIQRLLAIYGENHSFRRYATQLLDFIAFTHCAEKAYLAPPPSISERSFELPFGLRVGLGQLAVDQKPVPPDWALAWALSDPTIARRTPVTRCAELFAALFKQKYVESCGAGLALKVNRTKLRISYHPASSSLGYNGFSHSIGDLPDVSAVRTPVTKLQQIVDECTTDLDSYSRYLGRNPDKAETLEALLQLPVSLWPVPVRTELEDLKKQVGEGLLLMSFGELSGRLKSAGGLSREKVLGLARALESLHLGLEPDVLAGYKTPKAEDKIALFASPPEDSAARNAPAYAAAVVTLDLACGAALADGEFSSHELLHLTRQIDSWAHLSDAHRKRLKAHLRLGMDQPLPLSSLKKKLDPLSVEAKRSIGRFLAHLTQADGKVTPDEVKFLERVYVTLSLNSQLLYSDLHVVPDANGKGFSPTVSSTQKSTPTSGFTLNAERIAQLQKETEEVSALLAGVFAEEQHIEPQFEEVAIDEPSPGAAGILGLNTEHSAFVRRLVSQYSWSKSDLNDIAADMELMLDGTLEHINEMMLDMFEKPLTEGDDPIEINRELVEQLPI